MSPWRSRPWCSCIGRVSAASIPKPIRLRRAMAFFCSCACMCINMNDVQASALILLGAGTVAAAPLVHGGSGHGDCTLIGEVVWWTHLLWRWREDGGAGRVGAAGARRSAVPSSYVDVVDRCSLRAPTSFLVVRPAPPCSSLSPSCLF
jgi:hypothetical protein